MSVLAPLLQKGLTDLPLSLPESAVQKLLDFVALLDKWNRVFNLTAVRKPEDMVALHLLDSLAVAPYIAAGERVLDVGSGGGLPGIPLAIAMPDTAWVLIDTNSKKTGFLMQAKAELGLRNVEVRTGRVEALQAEAFPVIISRAFASLADFVHLAGAALAPNGRMLAMKSLAADAEIAAIPATFTLTAQHALRVPGLDATRNLIELRRVTELASLG